jgi:hypothetical protein
MKQPTVRLHAYLFAASLSAILIQVAVFISIMLLHVPERAFESTLFRAAVVAAIACALLIVRRQGRRALPDGDARSRMQAKTHASRASMHTSREPQRARHRRSAATPTMPRSSAR